MARKGKKSKYREMEEFPNVIQPSLVTVNPPELSCYWDESVFNTKQPVVLELGCGWGDYTVNLGKLHPERNFIGIDIKGARMWRGAKEALALKLENVLFVRIYVEYLDLFFPEGTVSDIWLTFPDPRVKDRERDKKRRLTSLHFLEKYKKILGPEGTVHLKTDNEFLFKSALKSIEEISAKTLTVTEDLYNSGIGGDPVAVQTVFERKFLAEGLPIRYLSFSF